MDASGPALDPLPTVLVVDDDPEILVSLGDSLSDRLPEAHVVTADCGGAAIERIRAGPVDVAVVDYRMPDEDGLEVLRVLHEEQPLARSMVLTAYPDMMLLKRAVNEVGVDRFFTKPPTPRQLHESVEACMWGGYFARVFGDDEEAATELATRIAQARAPS